jgi:hypothetical protein
MNRTLRVSFAATVATGLFFAGCGKKDADVAADAEKSLPAAEQMPTPSVPPAVASTGDAPTPDEAKSNADFEAWFKKHKLNLDDPGMLDADPDGDGFTNRDEFLADTNPNDAESRPGIHKFIKLREYTEVRLPFVLRAVEGDTARVEFEGEGIKPQEKVKKGDTIRGTKLKVDRVETRTDFDKHGEKVDMTQIVMTDGDTGDRVVAMKDMPTRTSASFATLVDAEGKSVLKVREGDTFEWPSEPGVRYKVIDLRHDQVVVKDEQSGKTVTIPHE